MTIQDTTENQFMWTKFIEPEKTELGVARRFFTSNFKKKIDF